MSSDNDYVTNASLAATLDKRFDAFEDRFDRKLGIFMESMDDKFSTFIETFDARIAFKTDPIEAKLDLLSADMQVVKKAVTATNRDRQKLTKRVDRLEAIIQPA